jgi:hypothetical protein
MSAHLPGHSGAPTHDLKALTALIPLEQRFPVRAEDLVELNPYAVDVRYADDWREP